MTKTIQHLWFEKDMSAAINRPVDGQVDEPAWRRELRAAVKCG